MMFGDFDNWLLKDLKTCHSRLNALILHVQNISTRVFLLMFYSTFILVPDLQCQLQIIKTLLMFECAQYFF